MKVYEFGDKNKPSIMLFPGTCCYWKTNFGHVLDGLQEHFHTLVISYSGFDDTENSTFISELDEVLKVENYIKDKLDGKLFAAYGCSLGGSFVSLLIGRQNIHIPCHNTASVAPPNPAYNARVIPYAAITEPIIITAIFFIHSLLLIQPPVAK